MSNVIKVHQDTWKINRVNTQDLAWQCEAIAEKLTLCSGLRNKPYPREVELLYKIMRSNLARRKSKAMQTLAKVQR